MTCKYCGRIAKNKNSNSQHEVRCPNNPNKLTGWVNPTKGKGHSDATRLKMSNTRKNLPDDKKKLCYAGLVRYNKNRVWSEQEKQQHSDRMKQAVIDNPESYTKNNVSGRVKLIEYNGARLKGSWELKVAKWLDANSIAWESEVNPQPYFWNGNWHLYYPDFYLKELEIYIEVKGYKTERDDAKWKHFTGNLLIIDKTNIKDLDKIQLQTSGQATILGS